MIQLLSLLNKFKIQFREWLMNVRQMQYNQNTYMVILWRLWDIILCIQVVQHKNVQLKWNKFNIEIHLDVKNVILKMIIQNIDIF